MGLFLQLAHQIVYVLARWVAARILVDELQDAFLLGSGFDKLANSPGQLRLNSCPVVWIMVESMSGERMVMLQTGNSNSQHKSGNCCSRVGHLYAGIDLRSDTIVREHMHGQPTAPFKSISVHPSPTEHN